MVSLSTRIKTLFTSNSITHDVVNDPLLNKSEIVDLLYRTQQYQTQMMNQYEIAHRRMGDAHSKYRGHGLDYEESRPYQHGDELRNMNWRLSARTGEMMMKVYREERRPGVFIMLDRRAAMRFGTRRRLKVTQAARAATVAAFDALQHNMTVSSVLLDNIVNWREDSYTEKAVFDLVNAMVKPCPPLTRMRKNRDDINKKNEPGIGDVLAKLCVVLTPGTIVYLFSDFIDLDETHRSHLMQLASQHDVKAIQILDPAEQSLPAAGKLRLQPLTEANNTITTTALIDTNDPRITSRYQDVAMKYLQRHRALFRSLGITYRQVVTTSDRIENDVLTG